MATTNPWNLYRSMSGGTTTGAFSREIDLREKLHNLLFGSPELGVLKHGRPFVVRHFRRDTNGERVPCEACGTYTSSQAHQNRGNKCRFCDGEGFLFDDTVYIGYLSQPTPWSGQAEEFGLFNIDSPMIFFEYMVQVSDNDKILEPALDSEGELVDNTISIHSRFDVERMDEMRSDYGRIEYIRCRIAEEQKR